MRRLSALGRRLAKYRRQVGVFLRDDKKPYHQMAFEALHAGWQERELPNHYLSRFLYRNGTDNYLDHFGNRKIPVLHKELNDPAFVPILRNKLAFHVFFSSQGIRVPMLLGYSAGSALTRHGVTVDVESDHSFVKEIERMIAESPRNSVFAKPLIGTGGQGILKLDADDLHRGIASATLRQLRTDRYIFQETLPQHHEVSAIYPNSINTVRPDVVIDDDGSPVICNAVMRFGGGRYVDNAHSGGCFVLFDIEAGVLQGPGHQFLEYGGGLFPDHPVTGVHFDGTRIPFSTEVRDLVKRAAALLPSCRLVGWDVAICPDGPVIIEANDRVDLGLSQISNGGYRKHPVFGRVLRQYCW